MSTRALGHRPTFDLTTRSAPVCTSTTGPFLPASRNPPLFLRPPRLPPYSRTGGIGSVEQKITILSPTLFRISSEKFSYSRNSRYARSFISALQRLNSLDEARC